MPKELCVLATAHKTYVIDDDRLLDVLLIGFLSPPISYDWITKSDWFPNGCYYRASCCDALRVKRLSV